MYRTDLFGIRIESRADHNVHSTKKEMFYNNYVIMNIMTILTKV